MLFNHDTHPVCLCTAVGERAESSITCYNDEGFRDPYCLPQYQTRAHLYETLGSWMKHVTEDKLQVYVESLGVQQFQEDLRPQRASLCCSVLRGLAQAMALPNPSSSCWTILCSATEKIFTFLPDRIQVQSNC